MPSSKNIAVIGLSAENQEKLNDLPKSYMMALSDTTQVIPLGANNAVFITDLELDNITEAEGFEVDATLGAYKNISGKVINAVAGIVSVHLVSSTASTTTLSFFSETSADGVAWTKNTDSARNLLVSGNDENYSSKSSQFFSIPINGYIRFRFYADTSNLEFTKITITPDGDTVTGPAFRHWFKEM